MHHFIHSHSASAAVLSGSAKTAVLQDNQSDSIFKRWTSFSRMWRWTFADAPALWLRRHFGTRLCQTLCRTEQIRMKYWVHLWISGAERPLVGASACIFSWWKPLDGSFLLAASLKSESQKCNASWRQKRCIAWSSGKVFLCSSSKSRWWSTTAPKMFEKKRKKKNYTTPSSNSIVKISWCTFK